MWTRFIPLSTEVSGDRGNKLIYINGGGAIIRFQRRILLHGTGQDPIISTYTHSNANTFRFG
jgi:hypothetical protein